MIKIYGFFLMIHGIAASLFVGFPPTEWKTSATVCTLARRSDMNKVDNTEHTIKDILNKQGMTEAWLGERVTYSRWTAYIGCSTSFSTNTEMITESFDDCVSYCSDFTGAYFAFQNDKLKCSCLEGKPVIDDNNGCRQVCQNSSEFACGTDRSAMVFEYVKLANLKENETFTDRECIARDKNETSYYIRRCNSSFHYVCDNESTEVQQRTWYDYQEKCMDKDRFILHGKNIRSHSKDFYWTPLFRTHLIKTDQSAKNEDCKSIAVNVKMEYVVKNCSTELPFLCSTSLDRDPDTNKGNDKALPSFITLPISVVISVSTVVVILLIVVVIMCIKQRQMKSRLEEFPPTFETTRRDNYPPPSKSPSANKIRLRDTYAETCDTPRRAGGYHDVYDDVNKGFILKR